MYSFIGNLDKIFGNKAVTKSLMADGVIEVFPIAYIRGVTMDNAICIIDEAQNMTLNTFKSIITRIGKNCKMIFLGDSDQSDLKSGVSCLKQVTSIFDNSEYSAVIDFADSETVRNPIIKDILKRINEIK